MTVTVESYLAVAVGLFVIGAFGFLTRRNLIMMFLSAEMMLHGVALSFVTFSRMHGTLEGQIFTVFSLTVATSEAGLALALILALYQTSRSLDVELWTDLREPDVLAPRSQDDVLVTEPQTFPTLTPAGRLPDLEAAERQTAKAHPERSNSRTAQPTGSPR